MSKFKEWFTEDEDDIFFGSPKSKFFDIVQEASREIVESQLDKIVERLAIFELLVSKEKGEDFDMESYLSDFALENSQELNSMKKGLYMEFAGDIICRLDS